MIYQKSLLEEEPVWFCIAGHFIEIIFPCAFDWARLLPSFKPFCCQSMGDGDVICSLRLVEDPIVIKPG